MKHVTLGASIHLFYLSTWSFFAKYAQTRGMRSTENQKKILFVVSFRLSKSLQWTTHQQESTAKNVATFSSKYHSPMEARNPILQGISCHHQKRRRSGKHWKANVHISNHTCLKQDKKKKKKFKTYPNFHTTKHMTLRVLWQIKLKFLDIWSISNQLSLPKINLLKQPRAHKQRSHLNENKEPHQTPHHHEFIRKLTKSNST